jgi:hypothetical protein
MREGGRRSLELLDPPRDYRRVPHDHRRRLGGRHHCRPAASALHAPGAHAIRSTPSCTSPVASYTASSHAGVTAETPAGREPVEQNIRRGPESRCKTGLGASPVLAKPSSGRQLRATASSPKR